MSVELFTLFVDDPAPVFEWLAKHCQGHVIRQQAVAIPGG
jgi:hypothetical protein